MQQLSGYVFPKHKQFPLSLIFTPKTVDASQSFLNPFLGYPNAPLLGRYNRGEYTVAETICSLQFKCVFDEDRKMYLCGGHGIKLPHRILMNLRTIPEIIPINKPKGVKNVPEVHPEVHCVLPELTFCWVVSAGQLAEDFINYLNHVYTLGQYLFHQEKLRRTVLYLPICAVIPPNSQLIVQETQRGISLQHFRAEYMSLHIQKGSPAFSPNNMRLAFKRGKYRNNQKKESKIAPESKNEKKKRLIEKGLAEKLKKQENKKITAENQKQRQKEMYIQQNQIGIDWDFMQKEENIFKEQKKQQFKTEIQQKQKVIEQEKEQIHFFTAVLLQNDYRVYYHWHLSQQQQSHIFRQILCASASLNQLLENYFAAFGKNELFNSISQIFL